ncbi:amino acid transporter AVT1I-like [Papaver somniferum]|uniref:amino acid transporter AVT1I-like n=1 Tax=Papaver somniferum TaxID=3469 RepID=UPI000E7057B2|nr:amino acid transporter AVT1I-like [Papaver somniferum]
MEEHRDALMNENSAMFSLTTPLQTDEESVLDNTSKETAGTSTFFKTCFNGINALSGVGILSVPYALASGGWLTLILLFIVAAATFYTGLLIRRCMDVSSKIRTYPDIGEHAFGKKGKTIVSSFMYLELYVVATGFLILEGDNLSNLFRNMSFTLAGVLLLCFVLCTISYATMAVLGYLMFGENIKSQVTLNLPTDKLSSKIAIYTTLVTPIAKYALMATPIVNAIESSSGINHNNKSISLLIRTIFLVSSVTVALAIPFFGYLMSLVGAFLSATASIIIPCLCYLKIMGTYRRWGYELVTIIGIILMGISVVVIGTYTSLEQISSEFNLSF